MSKQVPWYNYGRVQISEMYNGHLNIQLKPVRRNTRQLKKVEQPSSIVNSLWSVQNCVKWLVQLKLMLLFWVFFSHCIILWSNNILLTEPLVFTVVCDHFRYLKPSSLIHSILEFLKSFQDCTSFFRVKTFFSLNTCLNELRKKKKNILIQNWSLVTSKTLEINLSSHLFFYPNYSNIAIHLHVIVYLQYK